ncbi:hypothetical protein GCM10022234_34470 [Aeromicrobium panaciterrae]|uniref:hypothetical protein n=1 Tax=Aeromicrobium panaciterrae TaxID=363861 RepID=UPI0031D26DA0
MSTTTDSPASATPSAAARRSGLRTTTLVTIGALAILLAQLAIRTILGRHGYFSLDDFVFYTNASHSDLWDHDFLMTPYNGHVMPGAFAWVWISTKLAPLDFNVVFATMMAFQLVAGLLMWHLLRLMFGNRPAILLPLAVFAFSPITLPASWWWAAAINQQPQQIAMLLVLICHVRYVRSGRWVWALAGPVALAVGLLFFEKTAVIVPFVGLLTWLLFSEGSLLRSLLTALRRYWLTWIGYVVVLVPYTAYYVLNVPDQASTKPTSAGYLELLDTVIRKSLLPGLLGGPWRWSDTGVVDSSANPHPLMQLLAFVVVGVVVVLSVIVGRSTAIRAWILCAFYLLVLTTLLTLTRGGVIGGMVIGSEYRYLTDFCLIAALCGALAFLPAQFAPWWRTQNDDTHLPIPRTISGLEVSPFAALLVVILMAGSVWSAHLFADRWTNSPTRTYVANATRTMQDLKPGDKLYDGAVPTAVVWKLLPPANVPSNILGPLGLDAPTLAPGETTSRLREFSAVGELEPVHIEGVSPKVFDSPDCLATIAGKARTLPLAATMFEWPWIMQIDYVAPHSGTLTIRAGTTTTTGVIGGPTGKNHDLRTIYASLSGPYASVTLTAPGNDFCIKRLSIGNPQPSGW